MKKFLALLSATVIAISMAACGGSSTATPTPAATPTPTPSENRVGAYKPGEYSEEADEFDAKSGYKDKVTVMIGNDGKIASVDWDSYNEVGETKKTLGDDYGMKAVSAIGKEWYEQAEALEQELVAKQDPAEIKINAEGYVDGVSSCTIHASDFLSLVEAALDKAK